MARTRLTKTEAERALADGGAAVFAALRALPSDVDPALAAAAIVPLLDRMQWHFARSARALPEAVIDAVLARLEEGGGGAWSTFVRAYVGHHEDHAEAWAAALQRVLDLNTSYALGSQRHRTKLLEVAADRHGIEAARAVAASRESGVPWPILGVLVLDGAPESLDALLPSLDRAIAAQDFSLDVLLRLQKLASPSVRPLLANALDAKQARERASPVLELARRLFDAAAPDTLRLDLYVGSIERGETDVPAAQLRVHLDSGLAFAFGVTVAVVEGAASVRRTLIGQGGARRDDLGLGETALEDLPAWIARAGDKLGVRWSWDGSHVRTNLRGKKRDRLIAWVRAKE